MPKHIDRLDQARIALAASLAARPIAGGTPLPPGPEPVRPPPSFQDDARFFLSEAGPSLPDQKFPSEKSDSGSPDNEIGEGLAGIVAEGWARATRVADNALHHTLCGINRGLACNCRGVGFGDALGAEMQKQGRLAAKAAEIQKQWEAWNAGRTGQALNSTVIWGPAPFGAVAPLEPEGTVERLVEDGNWAAGIRRAGAAAYRAGAQYWESPFRGGSLSQVTWKAGWDAEKARMTEANMQRADEPVGGPTARYATCGCLETAHPLFRCPELRARGLVHQRMLPLRPMPGLRTIRSEYVEMPKGFEGFPEWNNRLPLFDAPTPYPGLKQVEPLRLSEMVAATVAGHTFAGVGSDEKCECGIYWHGIWGVTREDIGKPNIAHSGDLNEREYDQIQVKKARDDARFTVTF